MSFRGAPQRPGIRYRVKAKVTVANIPLETLMDEVVWLS